jgi:hypothetical protein
MNYLHYIPTEAMLSVYFDDLEQIMMPLTDAVDKYLSTVQQKLAKLRNAKDCLSSEDRMTLVEYFYYFSFCLEKLRKHAKREFVIDKALKEKGSKQPCGNGYRD